MTLCKCNFFEKGEKGHTGNYGLKSEVKSLNVGTQMSDGLVNVGQEEMEIAIRGFCRRGKKQQLCNETTTAP